MLQVHYKYANNKYAWSKTDLEYLTQYFPYTANKQLAKHFNISWRTIVRKARELNLQKNDDFRDQFDFKKFGELASSHPNSIATRFKPGQVLSKEEIKLNKKYKHLPFYERNAIVKIIMNNRNKINVFKQGV